MEENRHKGRKDMETQPGGCRWKTGCSGREQAAGCEAAKSVNTGDQCRWQGGCACLSTGNMGGCLALRDRGERRSLVWGRDRPGRRLRDLGLAADLCRLGGS